MFRVEFEKYRRSAGDKEQGGDVFVEFMHSTRGGNKQAQTKESWVEIAQVHTWISDLMTLICCIELDGRQ